MKPPSTGGEMRGRGGEECLQMRFKGICKIHTQAGKKDGRKAVRCSACVSASVPKKRNHIIPQFVCCELSMETDHYKGADRKYKILAELTSWHANNNRIKNILTKNI